MSPTSGSARDPVLLGAVLLVAACSAPAALPPNVGMSSGVGAARITAEAPSPTPSTRATGVASAPAPTPREAQVVAAPPANAAPTRPIGTVPLVGHDPLMDQLLAGGSAALKAVMAAPEKYRFQVVYGAITEGPTPTLERHGFRADAEYFYPASSMKMPITLATYERLAGLRAAGKSGLTKDATLRIHPVSGAAEPYVTTLARETWRALIVSDNSSANRILGIVGHREVHETLWGLGLASARVHDGFATGAEIDPVESSPRVEIAVANGAPQELPARRSDLVLPATNATGLAIGVANIVNGARVPGPLSFAEKNAMKLAELQDTLVRIMRPELLPPGAAQDPGEKADLAYVKQALGTFPSESGLAGFERNVVADYQLSPFLRGIERVRARGKFQIFTKAGQAYGFLIANAYIVDKETGRAFFLVASVYANPDEVMNSDKYAYDSISFPALADVGEAFTRHAFMP